MTVTILVGNCFRKATAADQAKQRTIIAHQAPDVALMCEAQGLGQVDGYQRFSGNKGHAAEVAVYIPEGRAVVAASHKVSDDAGGRAVWHKRYIEVVEDKAQRRVTIAAHLPADVKDNGKPARGTAGWVEWVKAMRAIDDICLTAIARGQNVYVGADFNFFEGRGVSRRLLAYWSPSRTFKRLGMTYVAHGLIGFALPNNARITAAKVIRPEATGSDHPWTVYTIKEK